jgi:hypothetical protein
MKRRADKTYISPSVISIATPSVRYVIVPARAQRQNGAMNDYEIISRVLRTGDDRLHLSVSASPCGDRKQGVISRFHECDSDQEATDFLEILVDQVRVAVEAVGGRIVSVVGPVRSDAIQDDGFGDEG